MYDFIKERLAIIAEGASKGMAIHYVPDSKVKSGTLVVQINKKGETVEEAVRNLRLFNQNKITEGILARVNEYNRLSSGGNMRKHEKMIKRAAATHNTMEW